MSKRNHFQEINETISVGSRNRERMFRKFGKQLFRDGPRFAKSTAVRDETDDEPRLAIEGLGVETETPILNKKGEVIYFEATAFDKYFASGQRPPVWLEHDDTKVVGASAELCLLNVGLAFRLPLNGNAATVKDMVMSGTHDSVSIGFTEVRTHDEVHFGKTVKHIDEAELREISLCPSGASKRAFVRVINTNAEPPLHESASTAMFSLEFDLHNVKVLSNDNHFNLLQLKRDLLLLEDKQDSYESLGPLTNDDFNRMQTEQYETIRAQRRAVLLGV